MFKNTVMANRNPPPRFSHRAGYKSIAAEAMNMARCHHGASLRQKPAIPAASAITPTTAVVTADPSARSAMGNADGATKEEDLFFFGKDDFIVVVLSRVDDEDGATTAFADAAAAAANMMCSACVFCYG